jgi:septum formation protein
VVLAADTEVVLDGRVLGKPRDHADAQAMLEALSGRSHEVVTGIAAHRGAAVAVDRSVTVVTFRALTAGEVAWYLATGEPDGKAGAYGLQGAGAALVERIDGPDTGVIGLPLARTVALLRDVGLDLLSPA